MSNRLSNFNQRVCVLCGEKTNDVEQKRCPSCGMYALENTTAFNRKYLKNPVRLKGSVIKVLLFEQRLSEKSVAFEIGCAQACFSRYVRGAAVEYKRALKISQVLKVPIKNILLSEVTYEDRIKK